MEKLAKSPLVYVVAQVRIGAVLKMADRIPEIQERMRKAGYSLYRRSEVRELEFGPGGTESRVTERWAFDRIDRTTGFSVQTGSVALQTTAYDTHEAFFADLRQGLEIVQDVVGIAASERLGLRYVDAFQASAGHALGDYLKEGLRGIGLEHIGARRPKSFTNLIMDTDVGGRLVVRIGLNPEGALPPNLVPQDLVSATTFDASKPIGILDYDHFVEKPEVFSVEGAMDRFNGLHGILSDVFRETVSDFALENWR
jgi:uncharacterized protein (TIGR04255 family)